MALAVGISNMRKDSKQAEEDSFGLIGAGAMGPILAVMILNMLTPSQEYPVISLEPAVATTGYRYECLLEHCSWLSERQRCGPFASVHIAPHFAEGAVEA